MLQDIQGTARAVLKSDGTVAARHDYLPFGEEIGTLGSRATTPGYGGADANRWDYGLMERDQKSGLDHTWFRKYESTAGRWTSPDPYSGSMSIGDPPSFNRYAYVGNDPLNFVDPTGLVGCVATVMITWLGDRKLFEQVLSVTCDPKLARNQIPIPIVVHDNGPGGRKETISTREATAKEAAQRKRYEDCLKDEKESHDKLMASADSEFRESVFGPVSVGTGLTTGISDLLKVAPKAGVGVAAKKAGGGFVLGALFGASMAITRANGQELAYDSYYARRKALCRSIPH